MVQKIFLFLLFCFNIGCAGFLFTTKHRVLLLEKSLDSLLMVKEKLLEENQVLRSELSYLTKPKRVHELILKFLPSYEPLSQHQLMTLNQSS